jgi:hypothetical protein
LLTEVLHHTDQLRSVQVVLVQVLVVEMEPCSWL